MNRPQRKNIGPERVLFYEKDTVWKLMSSLVSLQAYKLLLLFVIINEIKILTVKFG